MWINIKGLLSLINVLLVLSIIPIWAIHFYNKNYPAKIVLSNQITFFIKTSNRFINYIPHIYLLNQHFSHIFSTTSNSIHLHINSSPSFLQQTIISLIVELNQQQPSLPFHPPPSHSYLHYYIQFLFLRFTQAGTWSI